MKFPIISTAQNMVYNHAWYEGKDGAVALVIPVTLTLIHHGKHLSLKGLKPKEVDIDM